MPTLTTQIIDIQRAEKRKAWTDYRELVKRFHKPHKDDGAAMLELCGLLDLSMEDVEADARALQQMPALCERASKADEFNKQTLKLGHEVRRKRAEQKEVARKLEHELRDLIRRQNSAVQASQLARDAETQIPKLGEQHWRVFQAPAPTLRIEYATNGKYPRPVVEDWLSDAPPMVFFPHSGDAGVRAILKEQGYTPTLGPNVWALKSDDDEAT